MKPLAYQMRPESFDDIFGQDHLVGQNGIITKMLKTNLTKETESVILVKN